MSTAHHLLVVDDDNVTRLTLQKVLGKAGYRVSVAADGVEALEVFRRERPDMVLMDVLMPRLDGYGACREIRSLCDSHSLPILMLTGLNDMESIDRAFEAGASDFVTKPINWTLLTQRVRYALRSSEMAVALRRNEERLSQAQRLAKLAYWEYDLGTHTLYCAPEVYQMLRMEGHPGVDLAYFYGSIPEAVRAEVVATIEGSIRELRPYQIEHPLRRGDGEEIHVLQVGAIEYDEEGRAVTLMSTLQEITERKRAEALIEYQAFYDNLTGLPNRRLFSDLCERAIAQGGAQGPMAVLFLGLDRFKVVNDAQGHGVGDVILKAIALRLAGFHPEHLRVARFGADVFAILATEISGSGAVERTVRQLLKLVAQPITHENNEFFLTASIGIALYPEDCTSTDSLLKSADMAMYRAKSHGGNGYQFFTDAMNLDANRRLTLESELRRALERGDLRLHYQPQVDGESRRIVAMEALLRWQHPERGLISPGDFIPVAEASGLIVPMGEWILEEACQTVREWNERYGLELRVGVNLSARQFAHPHLVDKVERVVRRSGMRPEWLELEVTESVALQDMESCIGKLEALRGLGLSTAMDDFGTGYSSLSYLQRLPLHTLKIDRAFVKDIDEAGNNGAIARAIVAMAHSLGLKVVAEGVESEAQYRYLVAEGCDIIQGFLISRPLPAGQFEALIGTLASGVA